jgi:hypothetical protein
MKTDCTFQLVWERWDDPGASDGGGARRESFSYPAEVNGELIMSSEADEDPPSFEEILEEVAAHSPVTGPMSTIIRLHTSQHGDWHIVATIEGISDDAEAKDRFCE